MADLTPNEHLDKLLTEFIELDLAGSDPDPVVFLDKADSAQAREELVELIDTYLDHAPSRTFDASAYSGSQAELVAERFYRSLAGVSGRWPSVLPALRERARIRRDDLARQLASALGQEAEQQRIAEYVHGMEQGALAADGVSDKVINALGKILGVEPQALRGFGQALSVGSGHGPAAAPVFMRRTMQSPDGISELRDEPEQRSGEDPEQWDEVDRLFRAG